MKNVKWKHWCACLGLGILMAGLTVGFIKRGEDYQEEEICFSVKDSFCDSDRELELSTLVSSEIFYTEDGSTPSRAAIPYEKPILLECGEDPEAVTIRAVAYYEDGSQSEVCTRTYFLGKSIGERFSTMIVSISSDPENLFDYETGILVTGKLRDDYVLDNPDVEVTDKAPANYNVRGMASEREAHVEIWEPDGTRVISQNIGIRVHGGTSRGSDMKSLKLIARTQYGENRLSYALFPDERSDKTDTLIEEYKRVILRNHGNDGKKAYLRNELAQRLSAQAGFPDTQECRPAAVYLNGEYYGFEWLEEAYDEVYFESHYGTSSEQGSWQSVTPHRGNAETDSEDETEQKAVEDIGIVYTYLYRDLRNDADFEELQAILDVDNFLQYCAIEIYLSNPDWPDNNCKAYRWYSDTGLYENSYADGKWRFLLYDLDIGMARTGSSAPGDATLGEVLGAVESNWDRQEPLLRAILQREDMQERFVEIMEDMMEGAFSYENACAQIEQIRQEMGDELDFYMHTLAEEEFSKSDTEYESAQEAYEAYRAVNEEEIEKVKEFFRLRPETMREELKKLREYLA